MSAVTAPAAVMVPAPRSSADRGDAVDGCRPEGFGAGFVLVGEREQDVVRTRSRRAEPRAWLRSVVWLVGAGLHPRSGPATLVVARDLARRMDYRLGFVMYDLDGTVRRTGLSRATVKRHVKVLRELGALAWWRHGSKRNLRLPGRAYTATATIYAAVIPASFDAAMGHRLAGSGYEARVCGVTAAGRERAIARAMEATKQTASSPVDNSAVDNRSSSSCEPHSPGRFHQVPEVDVESGSKDTSRRRASRSTTSPGPERSTAASGGTRRTAAQTYRSIQVTRQVRARVNWTQGARLRRLAFVLSPWTDAGWDADTITAELHSWMLTFRPARPAEYIRAQLARQAAASHQSEQFEAAEGWDDVEASGVFTASRPGLVTGVLQGLAQGLAAYSASQAAQGFDDLSGAGTDAEADFAAFFASTDNTPAGAF